MKSKSVTNRFQLEFLECVLWKGTLILLLTYYITWLSLFFCQPHLFPEEMRKRQVEPAEYSKPWHFWMQLNIFAHDRNALCPETEETAVRSFPSLPIHRGEAEVNDEGNTSPAFAQSQGTRCLS